MTGGLFAGERAVVVGLGVAGAAAARVLAEEGASVRVTEARPAGELEVPAGLAALGVEVLAGGHEARHLDDATLVVTSPGVHEGARVLGWAIQRGLPVWSELELGARVSTGPYLAVTGTNGKTTTVAMLAAALAEGGVRARACGNIGYPFSLAAREGFDALAVEASSFQLRFLDAFRARVSVLLNLAPDHLDWHGTLDGYINSKRRVYANQGPGDVHVGNRDDALAASASRDAPGDIRWFTLTEPREGEVGYLGEELVSRAGSEVRLGTPVSRSASFRADAAAAAAAAIAFGVDPVAAGRAVCTFTPLSHRGDVVAEIDGVRFVDDSKATNPHATLAAIEGMRHVVLVGGGRSKGIDLSPLAAATPALDAVVVMGEAADEMEKVFDGLVPVRRAGSMAEAVEAAMELSSPGGAVVLAPACASHDMFRDYAERGDRFSEAAVALAERTAHAR